MQSLTLVEKHLIALVRLYITEVKLVAPLGDSITATGSPSLIGNIICFPQDGPKAAAARLLNPETFPWLDNILDIVNVTFIGTDKQYDRYMKHAFCCPELKIRGPVVISWLKMLKVTNPLYAGVFIDERPESFTKLLQLADKILENVKRLTDNPSINVERTLGSDIAGVRMHPSNNVNTLEENENLEGSTVLPPSKVAILTPILVTDSAGMDWLPKVNDEEAEILQQILDVINPIPAMKTSAIPLNEFTENDRLILGAFPHLFLLGRGVPSDHSLTQELYSHYMNQFTGSMARESQFYFFLSNQRRRHEATRSASLRVKNTPKAFEKFDYLVNNADFHRASERAVKNPLGKDAQDILKSTAPYIQMSGKHVAFSPMERNDAMTSLCAITQRYGTPSVFLTVSPDDTHHPMTLRIAFPSTSNVKFPAKPEKSIEALINEDEEYQQMSISQLAIHKLVTESPHVSATVFKLIMDNLFSELLGIQLSSTTKKTTPLSSRNEGVFGKVTAAFSVTEVQGRGALHAHCAIWGTSFTPDFLQKVSPCPLLVDQVAKVLDSMYVAMMPDEAHLQYLVGRVEKIKVPRQIYFASQPAAHPDYLQRLHQIMDIVQVHSHRKTCHKNKPQVRMMRPEGIVDAGSCRLQNRQL